MSRRRRRQRMGRPQWSLPQNETCLPSHHAQKAWLVPLTVLFTVLFTDQGQIN